MQGSSYQYMMDPLMTRPKDTSSPSTTTTTTTNKRGTVRRRAAEEHSVLGNPWIMRQESSSSSAILPDSEEWDIRREGAKRETLKRKAEEEEEEETAGTTAGVTAVAAAKKLKEAYLVNKAKLNAEATAEELLLLHEDGLDGGGLQQEDWHRIIQAKIGYDSLLSSHTSFCGESRPPLLATSAPVVLPVLAAPASVPNPIKFQKHYR